MFSLAADFCKAHDTKWSLSLGEIYKFTSQDSAESAHTCRHHHISLNQRCMLCNFICFDSSFTLCVKTEEIFMMFPFKQEQILFTATEYSSVCGYT